MSEPQRPPDDPSYFKRAVAQTRCNDARKEGASLSMSDPRYPPDDDPLYFKRAVVHGMIRCLYYDQQDALDQLIPQRDEARAVDDRHRAHALSSEIDWRAQLMDACIPYMMVKQEEARLLANASTEWLLKQIPYVDIPVGRIFARCCTEPHLRSYYLCLLAYRGVITWQDFKSLHRKSVALSGFPSALVIRLLDYIWEMEHRFGTELAALAPPTAPPAALTRHNDACKEGASPSMSDPRYPPDDDPSYFKRAVVHGMIRCLYYDQQDALEQLIPQRDEARAVDDQQQAHALSSEIEWREQLMDACIPYLKVKQDEVRLLANASTEWLLKQIPYVDIPVGRILARCCTEPHLRRYYLCLLAYRGVVTWQDFKSLHRESAALTGVPCALVTCLLDYIQEMEHRFGTELAALAPPPPPPAAQTRHSDAWLPAWLPAALQWIGETACGIYGGLTAHQPEHTSGGDIELHKHERLRVKKLE